MKLAFVKNINEYNEHALRLSHFSSAQANLFRETIIQLGDGRNDEINSITLSYIEPGNCTLMLKIAGEDLGISTIDNKNFLCELTTAGYKRMSELLTPFCNKESVGFQWLYDLDNPIAFLFSSGGKW